MNKAILSASLGFPRVGPFRELKKALEAYWKKSITQEELLKTAREIKKNSWQIQKSAGTRYIPSNDFSLYDHILDTIIMVGAVPERFGFNGQKVDLDLYFAMARGAQRSGLDVIAMEMTKWFDTNYHYIVPELKANQEFKFASHKIIDEYLEAKSLGIETRPVLVGPLTFLLLSKMQDGSNPLLLLPKLLLVYKEIFADLIKAGVRDLQIDEPCLVQDLDLEVTNSYIEAYDQIREFAGNIKLHLATYFEDLDENAITAFALNTDSVHIDLVRAPKQLDKALELIKDHQSLSLGLVDGRNIWINDLDNSINLAKKVIEKLGSSRVIIAPSCQLLHVPVDLDSESNLDHEVKSWLAFAKQKLAEINIICASLSGNKNQVKSFLEINQKINQSRKVSTKIHDSNVKSRVADIDDSMLNRKSPYNVRKKIQNNYVTLPVLPTTTIGSFPQTKEIRKYRADFKSGKIDDGQYEKLLKQEIVKSVKFQEEIGLDVLVHGEFERNDMVEYFGEKLSGFAFTEFGWVQSYGSRCVKPPIIYGDVSRPNVMTVDWISYAQTLTKKPMKGMLTGPITILQWSFVRNDQPRKTTALQIALAIRDEVLDLEKAGIKIIQIDEAALREGLPIKKDKWDDYLNWAVSAFKIASSAVNDRTQIHTHMCYSEFNDIIDAIAKMDADVISIETSRSNMELLNAFVDFKYPNDIGPGVYDIHSPRIPKTEEMVSLLKKAADVINLEQIWVNPDCGLKTRDWPETIQALKSMVEAAKQARSEF